MQLNPMDYNNTAKKVEMVRAHASTARRHTSQNNNKEVTEKPIKKTNGGQELTWDYTITRDLKPIELDLKSHVSGFETIVQPTLRRNLMSMSCE